MSKLLFPSRHKTDPGRKAPWGLLGGVAVTSGSVIAFELVLTRLLSILLSYHYVFAVVSLALLGHGVGAMVVFFARSRPETATDPVAALSRQAGFCALAMLLSTLAVIQIGAVEGADTLIPLYFLVLLIPFFAGGMFFAEAFRAYSDLSPWLYGFDLLGAAAGCGGILLALDFFNGVQAVYLTSFTAASGALLLSAGSARRRPLPPAGPRGRSRFAAGWTMASLVLVLTIGLAGLDLAGAWRFTKIPIGKNRTKEIHAALRHGEVIATRWSAFGQTDLIRYKNDPSHMDMYIDGTAGTPMYRFNGDWRHPNPAVSELRTRFPGYFPFLFLEADQKDNALVIGPGGGRDILLAKMGGIGQITAVEINKDFIDLVREYTDFNGGIYRSPDDVHLVLGEGRNYLKRQQTQYDLILLSLPATNSSRSREGFTITENFLLTVNSVQDYLSHLTPEGRLVMVTHGEVEALRMLSLVLEAFRLQGIAPPEAMQHLYLVGHDQYPIVVLQKRPLAVPMARTLHRAMLRMGYVPAGSYFPHLGPEEGINPALAALADGSRTIQVLEAIVGQMGHDISPVTDNSPFFFKFEPGIPRPVRWVLGFSLVMFGLTIVIPVLWVGIAKSAVTRRALSGRPTPPTDWVAYPILFAALGMGFMMAEITLSQAFTLFLGHPVLSLAVLLFALLAGAGIGSLYSRRLTVARLRGAIALHSLVIAGTLLIYALGLPVVLDRLLGWPLVQRLAVAFLLLSLLGFAMGVPFPAGMRAIRQRNWDHLIPWMWGINGIGSVLGSALAIAIAVRFGFKQVLWVSSLCYFTAFVVFRHGDRSGKAN